jgi:hypothetical protein
LKFGYGVLMTRRKFPRTGEEDVPLDIKDEVRVEDTLGRRVAELERTLQRARERLAELGGRPEPERSSESGEQR